MKKLLTNITKYYVEEIMKNEHIDKETAIEIFADALQYEDIEDEIMNFANVNKDRYHG